MRSFLIFIVFYFLTIFHSWAQKDTFIVKTNFLNQGEQEDYWTEKFFYEKYQSESYKPYSRPIREFNKETYGFDSTIVIFLNDHSRLTSIFKSGLLYPSLFTGSVNVPDTLKIDALEELKFLKLPLTKKRFRLWYYGKWQANPTVFLFELTNVHATDQTNMESFVKEAKLTFFKKGWRIL